MRNLPLSAADRRHVHHLLIGLGLNPRQAALMLYCFSGFLCGAVMLGVALRNEYLTLVLGISGCLVFLLVVTSRRDELANLRDDLHERLTRRRQERQAAKLAWEAIQRIELCATARAAYEIVDQTAHALGCELVQIRLRPRRFARDFATSHDPAQGGEPSPSLRVGSVGDLSTLRWPGSLDHGEPGPADGRVAGGRHRLSLFAAPLSVAGRLDGSGRLLETSDALPVTLAVSGPAPRHGLHDPTEASMDGIQATRRSCTTSPSRPASAPPSLAINPGRRQDDLELLQALRRRFWMVLAVAVPLAIASSIVVLKLPPVYQAKAEIEINPPEIDPVLSTLVIARSRPARSVEHGELRPQPRSQAAEQVARRTGRRATRRICGRSEPVRRPGLRAVQDAQRAAGQEDQLVHRLPGRQGSRPGPKNCWKCF